ncbi:MAG: hypothetical protein D6688_01755 [Alphaproteobacteria bacterium]|nr:MAG: hypothetical protein D6688_01755 [Alphaproteobacteria bacterium]
MQIDWWTLGLQALNFLVLAWLLTRFFYRPVRRVLAERQARAEAALREAEAREAAAEAERQRLEQARADFEAEKAEAWRAFQERLEAERQSTLAAAEEKAHRIIEKARKDAEAERRRIVGRARADIARLAVTLARRILSAEAPPEDPARLAEATLAALDALPEADRHAVSTALSRNGVVEVTTARPLDDAARDPWIRGLRGRFGPGIEVRFSHDPDILGGAILRLPDAEVRNTWSDFLAEAEDRLLSEAEHAE